MEANPRRAPLVLAVGLLAFLCGATWVDLLIRLDGRFTYAFDDAYIHLALARNLVEHSVWGVTSHGFTSASSSPLWIPLVAALHAVLPEPELAPLWLNLACALGVLVVTDRLLRRDGVSSAARAVTLGAVVLCAPLVTLVFSGMEHLAHALAMLLLFERGGRWLARDEPPARDTLAVCLLAAIAAGLRLESLFLVPPVAAWLAVRRRTAHAALFSVAACLPLVAFGAWSLAHGWGFLPEPVLLKSVLSTHAIDIQPRSSWTHRLTTIERNFQHGWLLACVVPLALGLAAVLRRAWTPRALALVGLACMATMQLLVGRVSGFFRYEAYVIVLGVGLLASTALSPRLRGAVTRRPNRWVVALVLAIPIALLYLRGARAWWVTSAACQEIHDQQRQLADFVSGMERSGPVGVNDIGAVAYYTDAELVDLVGLATREIALMRRGGDFTPEHLGPYLEQRGVEVIAGYERWIASALPPDWIEVASWQLPPPKRVLGFRTVVFYADGPDRAARLARELRAFGPKLPERVEVTWPDEDP